MFKYFIIQTVKYLQNLTTKIKLAKTYIMVFFIHKTLESFESEKSWVITIDVYAGN